MLKLRHYVDFEIIKENWNIYSISDGSKLKTRVILRSISKSDKVMNDPKQQYSIQLDLVTVLLCDPLLHDVPTTQQYSVEDYKKNIEIESCRVATITYEANEYILDDGTKILIHVNLMKVSRSKLTSINGDRIYHVNAQANMNIIPTPENNS